MSVISTSKSISNDCSKTCVPIIIFSLGRSPFFPISFNNCFSFSRLCGARKLECSTLIFSSPYTHSNSLAKHCARFTVLTTIPAIPPFESDFSMIVAKSSSLINSTFTSFVFSGRKCRNWLTLSPSVYVIKGYASVSPQSEYSACMSRRFTPIPSK